MTGAELVKMWADESNAANDCIYEILDDYMLFVRLVRLQAYGCDNDFLIDACNMRLEHWKPILEIVKNAKEKANEQSKTTE